MSAKNYLICGSATLADVANQAAQTWDPVGGASTFRAAFLYLLDGGSATTATHTACHGPISDEFAPAVRAAIAADFPGWQMIQHDDPSAALAQAGLGRVVVPPP